MKIYLAPDAPPGSRWQPTQALAKSAAGRGGGIVECTAGEDGRQGMCDMLNTAERWTGKGEPALPMAEKPADPRPVPGGPLVDPKPPAPRVDTEAVWTATQIEDFIFNRATVVQIGNIMGALGERFGELVAKSSRSER